MGRSLGLTGLPGSRGAFAIEERGVRRDVAPIIIERIVKFYCYCVLYDLIIEYLMKSSLRNCAVSQTLQE